MSLENCDLTKKKSWENLKNHFELIKNETLKKLFYNDINRFNKFHIQCNNILFDYSKNRITEETLKHLLKLANDCDLYNQIEAQFNGKKINKTENRAVLHTALRNKSHHPIFINGKNIMLEVNQVLNKIKDISTNIINGIWKGFTNKPITNIVVIGIGGSILGPLMVCEALKYYKNHLNLYFVSNIDGSHIGETLKIINPETTIFIVSSKTFTTQETITNAQTAKKWFLKFGNYIDIAKHFIAISSNIKLAIDFGIDIKNIFKFWDWVGGRYSLWGSIGLPISLAVGFNKFEEFLEGGYEMDMHFKNTSFEKNIPVLLGLIGIWYNNFFSVESLALLPYEQYLHRFADYFQQVDMESNGKCIDKNGKKVNYQTGGIIWGEVGTNGQHAFYQLIHQGTKLVPCDFFVGANALYPLSDHHTKLLANFFAQTEALAFGKCKNQVIEELKKEGKSEQEIKFLTPFKIFEGNIPSNSFLYKKLTPKILGNLIAMYEHKIYVQGVIWNIFSYDQWGVELGKQLANKILFELDNNDVILSHDTSTNGLINAYKRMKTKK